MPRRRRLVVATVVVVVLGLLLWVVPTSRVRVTAAGTVAEGLGLPSWRPFAPAVAPRETTVAGAPADTYRPDSDLPTVVLVPGAVPAGRDDPRVRRVATVLARADRRVVVPQLAVYDERLVTADVGHVVDVSRELADDGPVVLLGISFGGSLSLVAAADPRLDGHLAGVATFGAYADLVGVLQAATTGVSVVEGRSFPWDADPRAEEVVRRELTRLLPEPRAEAVRDALEAGTDPGDLPPDARAVHALLTNDDPRRTFALAERLPAEIRRRITAVSPSAVAGDLTDVPVVAMHSRDDPVIPYGELRRLEAALPHAARFTVDGLQHARLELLSPRGALGAASDLATVWSFTTGALRWQEPTWPWQPG